MSIVGRLLQRIRNVVNPPYYGIGTPTDLDDAIRRERSRSDRTDGQFAVVSFYAKDGQGDRRVLLPLANHLKRRARATDDLGWCRENKLCLILSNCTTKQATKFASELCRDFSSADVSLKFSLYYYSADASHKPRSQKRCGPPTKANNSERSHEMDLQDIAEQLSPIVPSSLDLTKQEQLGTVVLHCAYEHAAPMDELFVRRLPWWKRSLDIVVSATALVALSPLFAMIAIAIRLSSPGPVLFKQLRSGRGGQPFLLYKFRSMVVDAEIQKQSLLRLNEQDGPAFKMERDPRVTKIGSVLRALSFDELPQLWNVLRGDMSLVGPRPLPIAEAEACTGWQRQRTDVTPGLTCFWQVKDRRAKIPFVEWARMDIRYIGGRTLWTDLRLLAQTILFVIRRKGV